MRSLPQPEAHPTPFDAYERQAWAGRAEAFAGSFAPLCAHTVPALLDAAQVAPGDRVLDVGTGTGSVAAAAVERGAAVTAVDAEPSMVELARAAVPALAAAEVAVLPELPFADETFDAVVGNFVLNHVGQPLAALAELRRVLRPGGRLALTIWAAPAAPGQALLGRAVEATGVTRPAHLPPVSTEFDFPRTADGLAALLTAAGLREAATDTLHWTHRTTPQGWWDGAAAGVGYIGQLLLAQREQTRAEVRRHFDRISQEFTDPDGLLSLPHTALLVRAHR
ncbi:methyltransferase domain-containing protein [Kitasatospora acidiphila]|uniref:Methyltransferase domain-containing protein n=1 Tax=Kitasatospora acidiphila TaxID=2567942 RepID=A0A540VWP2_9ACTN|nr:class I SAM-dependent methyltransferase [Kitasatospora acidiphila]TQF01183.1 methyltransferase domain-containing protein [Kitasatospora acidiphila]